MNQSALTGESDAAPKNAGLVVTHENAVCQDKKNMVFSTTEVISGEATGVVVATGETSQLSVLRPQLEKAAEENRKTPLKERLDQFGETFSWVTMVICVLSWLVNFHSFFDPIHGNAFRGAVYYFKTAVSLAVAAIPQVLPAATIACLALATTRIAAQKVIVRQLASVEMLGCITVICSDKTGALTSSSMTVAEIAYVDEDASSIVAHKVHGDGLDLTGNIEGLTAERFARTFSLQDIARVCALCNNAKLKKEREGGVKLVGTATEGALRVFVQKIARYDVTFQKDQGSPSSEPEPYVLRLEQDTPVAVKFPFAQSRKSMSVIVRQKDQKHSLLLKGAPEQLLERCSRVRLPNGDSVALSAELKESIRQRIVADSRKAYRCIGFACKENLGEDVISGDEKQLAALASDEKKYLSIENDATFLGFAGIKNPPREHIGQAIKSCRRAGIKVIMVTGDNKETALAVGKEIGLISGQGIEAEAQCMDGREFDQLKDEAERTQRLKAGVCVFSRVEPKHKRELVQLLKSMGEIVAMTGGSVNDAPAIRQAHIGISLGVTGTDVAKEASKLILADDNFINVVKTIEEARCIYSNIKAFMRYIISSNIGEVVAVFVTSVLGFPEILSPVQLLWLNLVTDGAPAMAQGFNPPEIGVMEQRPRKNDEQVIGSWTLVRYFVVGTYIGAAAIAIFVHWYLFMDNGDGHSTISFFQLTGWSECPSWPADQKAFKTMPGFSPTNGPCEYFFAGKATASTLSLTVLIVCELFNALNCLSEHSLVQMPPWENQWLCLAIASSLLIHLAAMYIPVLSGLIGIAPLGVAEWVWVAIYSFPVVILDEIMKFARKYWGVVEVGAVSAQGAQPVPVTVAAAADANKEKQKVA